MSDTAAPAGEMKRSLTLTGITVNAMALIAPGAFLWTTFQAQAALAPGGKSTYADIWPGLLFALILALLTAYSYSELARIYPNAGTGSSYYFAEAALLDKEKPGHRKYARVAKLTVGWISHLYYWMYPGILVAFAGTLLGYIYTTATSGKVLGFPALAVVCIVVSILCGYIAFRGISGSTMTAIIINVVQIVTLVAVSIVFIGFRLGHGSAAYDLANAGKVIIPHNFLNVLYQSTIAILLLVGFESVTALGAEALRPEKDIKKGILLSLIIQGGICYLFEYFAAGFAVGKATITNGTGKAATSGFGAVAADSAPIGHMLKTIGDRSLGGSGTTLSMIMAVTVLIALIGSILACLNTGVRVTYAMAQDGEVPNVFGLLHGNFATPHGGIWVLTAVSALEGMYAVRNVDNLTQVTIASNVGTFIVYGITCVVAVVAFSHRHDKHFLKHYAVPGIGALMNFALLVAVIYLAINSGGATAHDALIALGVDVVWIALGVAWVTLNPTGKGKKLIVTDAARRTEPVVGVPVSS
jgi:APA family basic amino acid/polyamine antiporter